MMSKPSQGNFNKVAMIDDDVMGTPIYYDTGVDPGPLQSISGLTSEVVLLQNKLCLPMTSFMNIS